MRGTDASVAAVTTIAASLPELEWLQWTLLATKEEWRRNTWDPPTAAELAEISCNAGGFLVLGEKHLQSLVVDELHQLQLELDGETPAAADLWNEMPNGRLRPKTEEQLSDYIKRYLDKQLGRRAIVALREVEIRRGVGKAGDRTSGQRTDIYITGIVQRSRGVLAYPTSRRSQRQLEPRSAYGHGTTIGPALHEDHRVPLWCLCRWPLSSRNWDIEDSRRQDSARAAVDLKDYLEEQAVRLSDRSKRVCSVVLQIRL